MDRGAWWATVHKVTKSQTQLKRLNTHTHTHTRTHTHNDTCKCVVLVQSHSSDQLFATPRTTACQSPLLHCLLVVQTHIHWVMIPTISSSVARFSSCPQSFPASGSFPRESSLHIRWPKYWSFSFSISPSNEYSELISFRIDWFDLAVQRTLNSLLDTSPLSDTDLWVFLPQSSIFSCSLKCLLQSRSVIFDEVLLCRFSFYGLLFWCHI